jgi:hypothetical protein
VYDDDIEICDDDLKICDDDLKICDDDLVSYNLIAPNINLNLPPVRDGMLVENDKGMIIAVPLGTECGIEHTPCSVSDGTAYPRIHCFLPTFRP